MDKKMADFLSSPQNPIGQKAAVINALGWSVSGNGEPRDARAKQNAILYASFGSQGPRKNLNTDEIFSLGYLLLMDLYSDPQNALPWLEKAYQERPSSLTIRMIYALGQAQYHVQTGDYCKAWQTVDSSTRGNNLRKDLHPAAVKIIVDHMRGYKPYCSEPLKSLKSKGPGILI
ncbi:MAG: hypothetical protein HY552_05400 [Elusimicrobia bacterium]|nr:hypothetical protein [Elusimicrobiota bacterium]